MFTTLAMAIAQNVVVGWLWRRAQEVGSLGTVLVPIYLAMPPGMQEDVRAIFTGQGGGLTISAGIGLIWYLWTQFQSWRATVKPQVVTTSGEKIALPQQSAATAQVEAIAKAAPVPRPRTIIDMIRRRLP
jgi:hypothetical protein